MVLLCLLAGCGARQVIVEGEFPEPLMSPLPLNMGIWYEEEFANHEFFDEAKGRTESTWIVKTGAAQMQMWDIVLGGVFKNLEQMKNPPGSGEMNQVVDAVLVPKIEELQYAIPAHTNVKVYEIWMRYRFDMVTTAGEQIASWTMTSYGKTPMRRRSISPPSSPCVTPVPTLPPISLVFLLSVNGWSSARAASPASRLPQRRRQTVQIACRSRPSRLSQRHRRRYETISLPRPAGACWRRHPWRLRHLDRR